MASDERRVQMAVPAKAKGKQAKASMVSDERRGQMAVPAKAKGKQAKASMASDERGVKMKVPAKAEGEQSSDLRWLKKKAAAVDPDGASPSNRDALEASAAVEDAAAVLHTVSGGFLEPSHPLERTSRLSQAALLAHPSVDAATRSRAAFSLSLTASQQTYVAAAYSRSGRSLLLAGNAGHVAAVDWRAATPRAEVFLGDKVRDATFLHNDSLFAVAQRKAAYVYDAASGDQVHVLRWHASPAWLAFLPHHLLLASAPAGALATTPAATNSICYTDISTGEVVGRPRVGTPSLALGAARCAAVNLSTGTLHTGHSSGVVSIWSPSSDVPLARMLSHKAGVTAVAVSPDGHWAATAGADAVTAVWDLRTWQQVRAFCNWAPVTSLDISATGVLALSYSSTVELYKDIYAGAGAGLSPTAAAARSAAFGRGRRRVSPRVHPYMVEHLPGTPVARARFCPYEDLLGVITTTSFRTLVVPGAGEAALDSRAPNPYESRRSRREQEVQAALEKLPPASIGLSTDWVGGLEANPGARAAEGAASAAAAAAAKAAARRPVNKAKGRNKIGKQLGRKRVAAEVTARAKRQERNLQRAGAAKSKGT
ncbi:hypothetical protein MMPV_004693 [Pyropia vietnamensis]